MQSSGNLKGLLERADADEGAVLSGRVDGKVDRRDGDPKLLDPTDGERLRDRMVQRRLVGDLLRVVLAPLDGGIGEDLQEPNP